MSRGILLSPEKYREFEEASIRAKQALPNRRQSTDVFADGRIPVFISTPVGISGAQATVGGTLQYVKWTYTIDQATCSAGVWSTLVGGLSKTGVRNMNEVGNSTTVLSTGKVSNVPAGWQYCAISKVHGGTDIVKLGWAYPITQGDGTIAWWIDEVNILDGGC